MREIVARMPGARFFSLPGLGHGQAFRYSHQALPAVKQFLQEVTPCAERNQAVIRRVVKAMISGNFAGLDQFYSSDWRLTGQTKGHGPEAVGQLINQLFSIFSDPEAVIKGITANDDSVTTQWVFKGTQSREWMGIAPNGRRVRVTGVTVDHLRDGKIVESHFDYDQADLRQQLEMGS